jgi:hypothetical protein
MNIIKLTKADVNEILDERKYVKGDFEKHHRHNGGYQDIIFERDNKHYRFTYLWFEDDGIDWSSNEFEAVEVVESEKVIKYWKVVE